MLNRALRALITIGAAAVIIASATAQQTEIASAARRASLTDPVPVDPALRMATLPNGLRYYVRANRRPEKRLELRLVVRAGSILETDEERGVAHFVEHMAFNGSARFSKRDFTSLMAALLGQANGQTGYDETAYRLVGSTDQPALVQRSFQLVADWAHSVSFDPAAVDRERSIVLEELRLRSGADARIRDEQFPILLKGSRYADRSPIGTAETVRAATVDRLKRFYTEWYRPDLMAVVAVGDFDPAAIEALIKEEFGSIPAATAPRPRPAYDVPKHPGVIYGIATDAETTGTSVTVHHLLAPRDPTTVGSYRQGIVDHLFTALLNARLGELAQSQDPPFILAIASRRVFLARAREDASLSAVVKDGGVERGLEALLTEAERASRFGFSSAELTRQKQNLTRAYERALGERDARLSASRADEYLRNFLAREPLPSMEYEAALEERFLPEITLDEVNKVAGEWFPRDNRFVVVAAPQRAGTAIPTEPALAAIVASSPKKNVTPYVERVSTDPLLETPPRPGSITRTTTKDDIGITEWELANGVRVVLKPTTFKEDEILFRAFRAGGLSLVADADFPAVSGAAQVVGASGVGRLSVAELRKRLSGKIATVIPFINEIEEGLAGAGSRKDLETLFQLIYLRFTQPRADSTSFSVLTGQLKSLLANQGASPDYALRETLLNTLSQDHPRRRLLRPRMIDAWDLDQSLAFYRERFADASGFTFVFVGSFDREMMRPLVERYLGSLPSQHRPGGWRDMGIRPPTGVIEKRVEKGLEPKSQVAIAFTGPFENDQRHRVEIRAAALIVQSVLTASLREQLGATYNVSVNHTTQVGPVPSYNIVVQFACDPQRVEELAGRVTTRIAAIQTRPVPEPVVANLKRVLAQEYQTSMQQNAYLIEQISLRYHLGEDVASLWHLDHITQNLDGAALQSALRTYFNTGSYVKVTLMPEKK